MPYAVSLPFSAFVETHTVPEHIASKITDKLPLTYTRLRSNQGILSALEDALGADRAREVLEGKRQVVTSCGSGMTAAILWLGLKLLGVERVGLYDEVSTCAPLATTSAENLSVLDWLRHASREQNCEG